jgi:hypothetical protein
MFHDIGLIPAYSSDADRFEVDGANAALDFLRRHNISEQDIDRVWTAIALHTTPGIPQYMRPRNGRRRNGCARNRLGNFTDSDRNAVVQAFPRRANFKEDILQAFYDGIKHKPETTFGNVKADVLADKDPGFHRGNFCSVIRNSSWRG